MGALKARFTQASVNYIIERCIALSALVSVGIWIPGALPQADYEIAPFGAKQVRDGNALGESIAAADASTAQERRVTRPRSSRAQVPQSVGYYR